MGYPVLKRFIDIAGSVVGLLLLLPVGFVIGLGIKVCDRGPVFFGQTRVGRRGRPFKIWKFRSMVPNADRMGVAVTQGADSRITPIGRWLRGTKLDELPQLWNVLRGDMSFVGPRPEVPKYVAHYSEAQREVLDFRPGITDVASLSFRDEERLLAGAPDVEEFYVRYCLPKKIDLNLEYQRRASVVGDLGVIARTVALMLSRVSRARPAEGDDGFRGGAGSHAKTRRLAIVGAGKVGQMVMDSLEKSVGVLVVGFFDDDPHRWHRKYHGVPVVGMPECLGNATWRQVIDEVVVALDHGLEPRAAEIRSQLVAWGLVEMRLSHVAQESDNR